MISLGSCHLLGQGCCYGGCDLLSEGGQSHGASSFSADQECSAEVVFEAFDLDRQWGRMEPEGFRGGAKGWIGSGGGEAA